MSLPGFILNNALRNQRRFALTVSSVALSRLESLVIAIVGDVRGCALSWPMRGPATGTFHWSTFAGVAFEFRITAAPPGAGLLFAVLTGVPGGWPRASVAARQPVLEALRG